MDTFGISLFFTFILTRLFAYTLHDMKNYKTKKDKSKTLTAYLRKITGLDIHHFHIGILILFVSLIIWVLGISNKFTIVLFAIGISLFLDQIIPYVSIKLGRKSNYFKLSNLIYSLILHILVYILI